MSRESLATSVTALRKWQRQWLLRQYGDDGNVLRENLELSRHLDRVIEATQKLKDAELA